MGDRLGVWKVDRWDWVLKRIGTGETWWIYVWALTGNVLRSVHEGLLGQICDGPELGDMECFLVGQFQTDPAWWTGRGLGQKFPTGARLGHPTKSEWEIFSQTLARWCDKMFGWKTPMDLSSTIDSGFWLEILNGPQIGAVERNLVGKLWWWGAWAIRWRFFWVVSKCFPLGPSDGLRVRWFMNWVIWWACLMADCLVMLKSRLPAHFYQDARAEG